METTAERVLEAATTTRTAWPRILWVGGAFLMLVMLGHIVALAVTGGPVSGPVSLRKPADFAETGWLAAWSVALVLPMLRTRPWQERVVGAGTLVFGVVETAIMAVEAYRGVPSHYNFSTPFDAALMRGGAAGTAAVFLFSMVVLLVSALRSRATDPAVRLGTIAGIAVTLVGCVVGFVMVSNNSGVYQGFVGAGFGNRTPAYLGPDPATVGPEYLLLRPATQGGDLVLLHAVGVHGLVLLAMPAVLLARSGLAAATRMRLAYGAVAGAVVAVVVLGVHALRQLPLQDLSTPVLLVLAACAVAVAVPWFPAVRGFLRGRTVRLEG